MAVLLQVTTDSWFKTLIEIKIHVYYRLTKSFFINITTGETRRGRGVLPDTHGGCITAGAVESDRNWGYGGDGPPLHGIHGGPGAGGGPNAGRRDS